VLLFVNQFVHSVWLFIFLFLSDLFYNIVELLCSYCFDLQCMRILMQKCFNEKIILIHDVFLCLRFFSIDITMYIIMGCKFVSVADGDTFAVLTKK